MLLLSPPPDAEEGALAASGAQIRRLEESLQLKCLRREIPPRAVGPVGDLVKATAVALLMILSGLALAQQPPGDAKDRAMAEAAAKAAKAAQAPSEAKSTAASGAELAKLVKAQTDAIKALSEKVTALEERVTKLELKKP